MKKAKRRANVRDRSRPILNPNRGFELGREVMSLSIGEHMDLQSALGGFLVLGALPHTGDDATRGFVNESLYLINATARRALEAVGVSSKTAGKLLAAIRGEMLAHRKSTDAFRRVQKGGKSYVYLRPSKVA
jgi:hypothetical protein